MDKQTLAFVNEAGLPFAILAASVFSYACTKAAAWFTAKTHNERAASIFNAAGQMAGDVVANLRTLPPGSDIAAVKTAAVAVAVQDLKDRAQPIISKLGYTDATLTGIVAGEIGKLQANATAPAVVHIASAAVPVPATTEGTKN